MSKNNLSVPFLWLTSIVLVSCSSEEIRKEPFPNDPSQRTVALRFRIGTNAYTKAEEGNAVENLILSFYNSNNGSPLFLQNAAATKEEDGIYVANIEINPLHEPDLVLAYINIDEQTIFQNINSIKSLQIDKLSSGNGSLIMTTPRYFDEEGNDIMFQSFDYLSSEPIRLELERVASKVSVTADNIKTSPITLKNLDGSDISLSLNLTGWGLTATDKSSYLIRNIGSYNEMNSLFSDRYEWNNATSKTLSWAYSVSYGATPDVDELNFFKLSSDAKAFKEDVYSFETTRPEDVSSDLNSKPSVVITGYYTQGNNNSPSTFYKYSSYIINDDELVGLFLNKLSKRLLINGQTPTKESLLSEFEIGKVEINDVNLPTAYVTLKAKASISLSKITKANNEAFTNVAELNAYLYQQCGVAEMFKNGKCYFTFPIEHYRKDNLILYGMVRNHLYNITLNSISGMGSGIADEDQILGEETDFDDTQNQYNISFSLSIRDWTEIEQNVNIEKK